MARISGTPSTEAVVGDRPTLTLPVSRACAAARAGLVGVAQGQLGLAEERQPGLGRHSALGRALQQPGAQLALQPADLLAQADCTMSRSTAARPMEPSSTMRTK